MAYKQQPPLNAKRPQGRPMANGGGLKRARKRLRKQIKAALRKGRFDYRLPVSSANTTMARATQPAVRFTKNANITSSIASNSIAALYH